MEKHYLFLVILLMKGFCGYSQANTDEDLLVTISTSLDTFNADEYYEQILYERDSFFKITIQNIGKTEIKLPASLGPSYEKEPSGIGDYYFRTYYDSSSRIVFYNKQTADIDYFFDDPEKDIEYKVLRPGEKRIIYRNPLTINGVPKGINKVYVEVYLRLPSVAKRKNLFKSNRISLYSIYK